MFRKSDGNQSSVSVSVYSMKSSETTTNWWSVFLHHSKNYSSLPLGYVGAATVGAAAYWFLYDEEGPKVTYHQLVSPYLHCPGVSA